MMSIFGETEKLRGLIAADRIECSPSVVRTIAGETKRGQQFPIKLHRAVEIFHSQVNVIEDSCLHCDWIFLISAGSSGNKPDLGKRAVSSRQFAPLAPEKTCLKIGRDSATRFMFTSATACQKRISESRLGSTFSAFDAVSSAAAYSRSALSLS